jgi:hypothetical protein
VFSPGRGVLRGQNHKGDRCTCWPDITQRIPACKGGSQGLGDDDGPLGPKHTCLVVSTTGQARCFGQESHGAAETARSPLIRLCSRYTRYATLDVLPFLFF